MPLGTDETGDPPHAEEELLSGPESSDAEPAPEDRDSAQRLDEVPPTGDPEIDGFARRDPKVVGRRFTTLSQRNWLSHQEANPRDQNDAFVQEYLERNKGNPDAPPPQRPHDESFPVNRVKYKVDPSEPLELVRVSPEGGGHTGGWLMLREDFD
ncbi:MAG: hypothetical protein AAF942_16000 [Pseudomonadota bacterium]